MMKTRAAFSITFVGLLFLAGCSGPEPADEPSPEYRPTTTIRDVMFAIIDPSADEIWESVSTVFDLEGMHEEIPETDEDWEAVRSAAIRVLEGTNLILIPGRRVAEPGAVSEESEVELSPDEIQELIGQDPQQWTDLAHGLHDVAMETLAAINARDTEALLLSGESLDVACERCHLTYWYPNDDAARSLFEREEELRLQQSGRDQP